MKLLILKVQIKLNDSNFVFKNEITHMKFKNKQFCNLKIKNNQ